MNSIFMKREADVIVYGAIRADHCMQAIQTDSSRSAAKQVKQADVSASHFAGRRLPAYK
jgi:hypothetical protein